MSLMFCISLDTTSIILYTSIDSPNSLSLSPRDASLHTSKRHERVQASVRCTSSNIQPEHVSPGDQSPASFKRTFSFPEWPGLLLNGDIGGYVKPPKVVDH
jgi:hypothetical protein